MVTQILAVIGSILVIVIGYWKYTKGKEAKEQKRKEDAANEIKQGITDNDPSRITGGFDSLNRMRKQ